MENDMNERILKFTFGLGPLLFGLLFIPPAFAQIVTLLGWTPPFSLSPLMAGFIIGGVWGLYAQIRGSWISWTL